MSKSDSRRKKRLAKAGKKNRRIPAFVMIRTNREVSRNRYRRDWRTDKLSEREKE
ncbi:MAG TPA: 50S ribosomal protein L39e [Chromatiaceae bacterium]|nr:50S ribosomal protein L39e [Chromatiaceae bacterium]